MKTIFTFFLIFISQLLTAQNCPIEGQVTFLRTNYVHDTLSSIDVKVSFINTSTNQIYLLTDTGLSIRSYRDYYIFLSGISTGCFDTTKRDIFNEGLSYFILDSAGNVVERDSSYSSIKLGLKETESYYENIKKPSKKFDALTISRTLGLPLKHIYEPMVWDFFNNYSAVTPILPLQTHSVVYSLKLKSIASKLTPNARYSLHIYYCAAFNAKYLNEYLKPQLEIEVSSLAYRFEPISFRVPSLKSK